MSNDHAARKAKESLPPNRDQCMRYSVIANTRATINDELLTDSLRAPLSDRARGDMGRSARWKSAPTALDRSAPSRCATRPGACGARGKMQKFPAGKFQVRHGLPLMNQRAGRFATAKSAVAFK